MASSIKDIYITGLVNAHALEEQAISLLSRQAERIESYPEMLQQIRLHIEESRRQATRLEEILASLGTSHSTLKDLATKLTGTLAALAHVPMQDEVMKNTFANFAFEHFEIASYRSLLTMAELAGDNSGPKLLQESLNEEIRMAKWIEDNLDATTRTYMQRTASGQKAGI
ncbi:ferritin-like domain-containing protein [Paracraurococcus ruber]|nr:ferritin-like domain-containing protein [Paracraurococcus ruber]